MKNNVATTKFQQFQMLVKSPNELLEEMEEEERRKVNGMEKKESVVYAVKKGESWDRLSAGIRKFLYIGSL